MILEMGHREGINTDLPVTMTTSWTFLEQTQSTQEQSTRIENTSIANERTTAFGQLVPGELDSLAKKKQKHLCWKAGLFLVMLDWMRYEKKTQSKKVLKKQCFPLCYEINFPAQELISTGLRHVCLVRSKWRWALGPGQRTQLSRNMQQHLGCNQKHLVLMISRKLQTFLACLST